MTKINLPERQYTSSCKLEARQAIYRYSQNEVPFWEWLVRYYPFQEQSNILEVGCGNGIFWEQVRHLIPNSLRLTLIDYSKAMLDAVKDRLPWVRDFEQADVEELPYADNSFHAVLSHLMLYHVNDPAVALSEMKRVLKVGGFCGIVLPDNEHLQAVFDIIDYPAPIQAQPFASDHARQLLPQIFSSVDEYIYTDIFEVTDVEVIVDYVRSLDDLDNKPDAFFDSITHKINKHIDTHGFVRLCFQQCLFVTKI